MYVPYGGDIRFMEEITRRSGQTLIQIVSKAFNKMKSLRMSANGSGSFARKLKWNAS
ncbi:MAG TPA: hypothetical protein VK907_08750 [Phnomibacter sp.]|nr:hypothetical protein [Phnomibacter sp.]